MSGDRIQTLREVYVIDPAWNKPADPAIEKRFQRIKAKLSGYMSEPERTLRKFPESNTGIPARYARAGGPFGLDHRPGRDRSEEHTSELQSLMRTSYAVFCLKKKKKKY